MKDMLEIHVRV